MTQLTHKDYAEMSKEQIVETFQLTKEGLNEAQVESQREKFGTNTIDYGTKKPIWREVIEAYFTPFTLVLIALAAISFFTEYVWAPAGEKDIMTVVIIFALIIISGTMTFVQSVRSGNAAELLQSMVKISTAILRDGKFHELPVDDAVVGDTINLATGDMIPADLRIIEAKDLFISQTALTGESHPVEKLTQLMPNRRPSESVTDYETLAFMGSNVISGSAIGVVIATGEKTLFGKVAKDATAEPVKTQFELGVEKTSHLLIRFMLIMAPLVILINGFTKGDWVQALLFGLSVAVGLTPEMLPMIVTTNLVKGANIMAKEGTIVKNINSIQNFGAMDILCTDKTGTLTQDKIVLEFHMDLDEEESDRVLRYAFLNSYYQTGFRNHMDKAIIESANRELDISISDYTKIDEIPFDFKRRRMSVVVKDDQGNRELITKGAMEEMLSISSWVEIDGEMKPLDSEVKARILKTVDRLNEDGMRVIGLSYKNNPPAAGAFGVKDEKEMVLIGYLAFLDPPKESTQAALEALKAHSVDVKIITGDNALVTKSVASQVGLDAQKLITGEEIAQMNEAELKQAVEDHQLFVKINPDQKALITSTLRENGHTVGFMGDGINDAPALRVADVGISVDTAVDIAKESADIILLEKDLMILEQGVLSGRTIFGNIMKYIKATTSSNFGNIFSVLIASLFLPFMPMEPVQLLVLNLIYDISCMAIPWDRMDPEYLLEPKDWNADTISRFMVWFGPTSSIFDVTTFALLFWIICPQIAGASYHTLGEMGQEHFIAAFHSGWFIVSLWTQTFVLYALRTPKLPFIQSSPSFIMTTLTLLGMVIGTSLPFTPIGHEIGLTALPASYFFWVAATVIAYIMLVTLVKRFYIERYQELL